jgi:hypothetical protein
MISQLAIWTLQRTVKMFGLKEKKQLLSPTQIHLIQDDGHANDAWF